MNHYLLISIIIIQFCIIFYLSYYKKENLTETDTVLAGRLYSYLISYQPGYVKYLDFLINNNNLSLNLIKKTNYEKLIKLAEDKTLSKYDIVQIM
jgi:hypothetical protein